MDKINRVDRPFSIQTKDKKWNKPINNIDCMRIYFKQEEIKKDSNAEKKLFCGLQKMTIDLETNTVEYHYKSKDMPENETFYLVRS